MGSMFPPGNEGCSGNRDYKMENKQNYFCSLTEDFFQLAHSFVMLLWDFACPHRLIPTSWL